MPNKLNNFSSVIIPSIFKVYLSSIFVIIFEILIYGAFLHFNIPGKALVLFILAVILQEHMYRRIGNAVLDNGQLSTLDYKNEFIAKTLVLLLFECLILFIITYVGLRIIDQSLILLGSVIIILTFIILFYIFNAIMISYAVEGTSLGEGIHNGIIFIIHHPILNLSLGLILAALTVIPFAGSEFFFIGFVIAEYIRTYKFVETIENSSDFE